MERKGGREMGDDTQQRAAGQIRTRAAAKDSAYMGSTLLLGELGGDGAVDMTHAFQFPLRYINQCVPEQDT